MMEYEQQIAKTVASNPNVESLMASVGGATSQKLGGPNYGELMVHLKPRSERDATIDEVMKDLRPKLANIAGMKVYLQTPPTVRLGEKSPRASTSSRCSRPTKTSCMPPQ